MKPRDAQILMRCHRPWRSESNRRIRGAVAAAQAEAALAAELEAQTAFDAAQVTVLEAVRPSEELLGQMEGALQQGPPHVGWRGYVRHPLFVAAVCGALLLAGLMVFFIWQRMQSFPGCDAVIEMVEGRESTQWTELEPVNTVAGRLGDWFFMQYALEHYDVAPALAEVHADGCRVFKQRGRPVAQVVVASPEAVLYVFRAADLGVRLPRQDEWRFFAGEEWAGAVTGHGDFCTVVAVRGDVDVARETLEKLTRPAAD